MHQGNDHSNVLLMHKLPEVSQSGVYGPLRRNNQIILCALMVNRLYAIRIDVAQIGLVGLRAKRNRSLLIRMHITVYVHVLEIGDHLFRRQLVEAPELVSDRLTVAIDALEERERFLEGRN